MYLSVKSAVTKKKGLVNSSRNIFAVIHKMLANVKIKPGSRRARVHECPKIYLTLANWITYSQGTLLKNRSHYLSLRVGVGRGNFLKGGSHKNPPYPQMINYDRSLPQVMSFFHMFCLLIKSILESEEFWPRYFFLYNLFSWHTLNGWLIFSTDANSLIF